ncbi:MAG TPA: TonB family protein [Pyrinomonadaceae bacterium]|nr:TonB family protein [Pyrinomonadaceae bacterium]
MNKLKRTLLLCLGVFSLLITLSGAAKAQNIAFNYYYQIDMTGATEPPQITGSPDIDFPEAARKNGVEGTLKAVLTLGEDGKVRDIIVSEGLPHGVTEAVTRALQNLPFQPAGNQGKPVAVKMLFDFVVAMAYGEGDKNVNKPKILEQPAAIYPEKYRAEKIKGKVRVGVMFYTDGKVKVTGINSVMPKEFDQAAAEAAAKIKFQPAVHKKSKKPVAQAMTVEYDFKP